MNWLDNENWRHTSMQSYWKITFFSIFFIYTNDVSIRKKSLYNEYLILIKIFTFWNKAH